MKLLIASNNKHKIEEISAILKGVFDEIASLADEGIVCNPEENGSTFMENAVIKATTAAKLTNLPVLADDTGLCVDALGGRPGVYSARFAKEHDDAANRRKLLCEMKDKTNRAAHFECAVALVYPNGKKICASGRVNGHILRQEAGHNGFGYDSLFFCDELGKTFAEATSEEKNRVSHRGRALEELLNKLQ